MSPTGIRLIPKIFPLRKLSWEFPSTAACGEDSTWIICANGECLGLMMKFIKEQGLGGAMFWEMSEDNTRTLLNTLFSTLNQKTDVKD
ncbi:hypothetical protein GCM10009119_40210 [Algoriphagus jejuensis]|uniref:GH18 domain-containing protein n=1 Tax=Algoriphagus jejuensis TaxID=419934 RepID=A0ABP3YHL5_9BACT